MASKPYDPLSDLITYLVWSRKSMRMRATHAQAVLTEQLGITDDMDPDEAGQRIRQAIEQPPEPVGADWPLRCEVHGTVSDRPATRVVLVRYMGQCLVCEECAQGRGPMLSLAPAVTRSWTVRLVRESSALDLLDEGTDDDRS
jgi:hypothetical protein